MEAAHGLTAIVPPILDTAGVGSINVEESLVNQIYEILSPRISGNLGFKFSVSELLVARGDILAGAERRVVDQISIAVDSVGR